MTGMLPRAALLVLAALLSAGATAADVLVLRDGSRVETEGPWEERGQVVVFHLPGGALSSLRLADVDLDASRAATVEASGAEEPPPARTAEEQPPEAADESTTGQIDELPVEPTDASPTEATDETPTASSGAAGAESDQALASPATASPSEALREPEAQAPRAPPLVEIAHWEEGPREEHPDGVLLVGTLRNAGADGATSIKLRVRLLDGQGKAVATADAGLSARTLMPGETARFRAVLPAVAYREVRFDLTDLALPAPETAAPREAPAGEPDARR